MSDLNGNEHLYGEYQKNFDNFRKIRDLKAGAHGIVSLFEDPSDGSQLAIKSFYNSDAINETNNQDFKREIQALINIQHPCIIPIKGFSPPTPKTETTLSNPPKIATMYAQNGSLSDIIEKIKNNQKPQFVDDTWIASAIISIILGMKHIHSRHYIHRDLKPGNILIDENGNVMIGDLGSSRFADLNISYTKMVGSPFYMAPEMYDEGQYSQLVDVYSFSVILYELLVGEPVFPKNIQPLPLMRKVCDGTRPEIPDRIHPEIADIIRHCWDVSPDQRYTFSKIFEKLKNIDFQITPNVDSNRVKELIRAKTKIDINVRLFNGELMHMVIYPDETLIGFRRYLSRVLHLPLELIIPSINGRPLSCCWGCNLDEGNLYFDQLIPNWINITQLHNNFTIDLLYKIKAIYFLDNGRNTDTSFYMKPGTISEMISEVTSQYRNLWFLNKCDLRILYKNVEINSSNELMVEKGIPTGCVLKVYRKFDKKVTIENIRFEINLNDTVEELLLRYMETFSVLKTINKIHYLEKNGNRLNEKQTLGEAGIVDNDVLQCKVIDSDRIIEIVIDNKKGHLHIPPNITYEELKFSALYVTKCYHPIGTIELMIPRVFIDDNNLIDENEKLHTTDKLWFKKMFRYCINEYRQY